MAKSYKKGDNMLNDGDFLEVDLNTAIDFFNEYVFGVGVPIILIFAGLFFCFKLKFFHFLHPIKIIKALKPDGAKSGVSSFGAMSLALAGTLDFNLRTRGHGADNFLLHIAVAPDICNSAVCFAGGMLVSSFAVYGNNLHIAQ